MLLTTWQSKIWKEENVCEEENAESNIQRNSAGMTIVLYVLSYGCWRLLNLNYQRFFPVQDSNGHFENSEAKPLCVAQRHVWP